MNKNPGFYSVTEKSFYPRNSIEEDLNALIVGSLKKNFGLKQEIVEIEYPSDRKFGDYSCNISMKLTRILKRDPIEIANILVEDIRGSDYISRVEIKRPGFINIFLDNKYLIDQLRFIGEQYGKDTVAYKRKIITDISHPNAAKPLGVHHLLSTIIGNSINNILKYVGHEVIRDSYWGDWGTQFGKLIYAYKSFGDKDKIKDDPIPELLNIYVEFHNRAEEDPSLDDKARYEFKKLEDGDKENVELWGWIVKLSKDEFFKLYKRLGIVFDYYYGESFYLPLIDDLVIEGKKKNVFIEGEEGALVVEFKDIPTCPVVKSDGTSLYHTRDIARIKYWLKKESPDEMVYVVDAAQKLHFIQLFEISKMLGLSSCKYRHASFGRMRFKDKSMSTRKGNILLMEEVLNESVSKAEKIIEEKQSSVSDKQRLAEVIGIGAVKYSILSQNRTTDIVFDWDRMLAFDGNSSLYIQYTYTRVCSIIRKSEGVKGYKETVDILDIERDLIVSLIRMPRVVLRASKEYCPHIICNYIYEVCQLVNSYYNSCHVLNEKDLDTRGFRVSLLKSVITVIKIVMDLLQIELPEKM